MGEERTGILFVIAAPSGTGKSTVARRVLERLPGLEFSISYTTRPPREGERDGNHYHFVGRRRFEDLRDSGEFLESATVFGNLYGTRLEESRRALERGKDLLLDIDVQGARQVRQGPIDAVSIMILPPDFATLAGRLADRGSEDETARHRRLAEARDEAGEYVEFDYLVINEDLEATVADVCAIVRAARLEVGRRAAEARRVLATFPSA